MAVEEIGVKLVAEGQKTVEQAFESCEKALKDLEKATDKYVAAAGDQEDATSNVEKAIRGARSSIAGFDKDIMIAGRNMGSFADAASAMGISLPATPMAALGMGVKALGEFMKKAMDDTVAYASQVRDLGRITGATAEDTSRLIQVSDDLKVEYGTLQQAAKALAQDGIALTTEELAKASDEYLAITDAGERAEYAVKKFGRAGLELTKVLEVGGQALRNMAAEQKSGLILTEAQVKAARDLEIAQDDLNDTNQALTIAIGNELIPVMVELSKGALKVVNALLGLNKEEETATQINWRLAKAIIASGGSFEDFNNAVKKEKEVLKEAHKEEAKTIDLAGNMASIISGDVTAAYRGATQAAKGFVSELILAEREIWHMALAFAQNERDLRNFGDTSQWSSEQFKLTDNQLNDIADTMQNRLMFEMQKLATFMGGAMGKENANYTKALQAEEKSLGDIQRRMRELLTIKSWTKEETAEYGNLLTKQDEVKAKIEEVKTAHALAAKKILFDMLQMQLAVGGLSKAESDFLIKTAKEWGLIDQATVDAWEEVEVYAAKIQDPAAKAVDGLSGSLDNAIGKTDDLAESIRDIPDREVNINITETTRKYTKTEFGAEPGPAAPVKVPTTKDKPVTDPNKPRAMGGQIEAGQPYLVGERGPELIVPDLSGMVMPNHMVSSLLNMMRAPSAVYNTTTINYNLGVTTMNSPQAVQRSFAMMQLLAG